MRIEVHDAQPLTAKAAPRLLALTRRTGSHLRPLLLETKTSSIQALLVEATVGGRIAGWAAAWRPERDDREVSLGVYVRASMRRRGLGSVLVAACRAAARRRWPGRTVCVYPVDEAGRSLYRTLGWQRFGAKGVVREEG
jgi:GNAT superfamily N-acetyltransferase